MRGAALNCWLAVNGIQKADMSAGVLMSLIGFMVAKVGLEQHLLAEVVADLRLLSAIESAVGVEAYFAEAGIDGRFAPGPGDPRDGVDDRLPTLGNQAILL